MGNCTGKFIFEGPFFLRDEAIGNRTIENRTMENTKVGKTKKNFGRSRECQIQIQIFLSDSDLDTSDLIITGVQI